MWNLSDDVYDQHNDDNSPKAERDDPPKSMIESKTGNSAIAVGGGQRVGGGRGRCDRTRTTGHGADAGDRERGRVADRPAQGR